MLIYKYIKEHTNYDLTLNKEYEGYKFKEGWILIKSDNNENQVLYREECFEQKEMICYLCNKIVDPLAAHIDKLNDKIVIAHTNCWNNNKIKIDYQDNM